MLYAEMAVGIYNHSYAAGHCCPRDAGNKRGGLGSSGPDADGVGLACHTGAADIDVVAANGEVSPGGVSQGNVAAAAGVVEECAVTVGCVLAAGGVEGKRISAVGGVAPAGGVKIERLITDCRVIEAGCEAEERALTLSGVQVRVAPVRWWIDCPREGRGRH